MTKLSTRDSQRFFRSPDHSRRAVLIYGPDRGRIAHFAQMTVDGLAGENGRNEMRISKVDADTVRNSSDILVSLLKAQSFFPGRRVIHLDGAGNLAANAIANALKVQNDDDGFLVVTAGSLKPASALRKLFETHRTACSAPVYADPCSVDDIRSMAHAAGLAALSPGAADDLAALHGGISPAEMQRLLEKLALYKGGDRSEVSSDDVEACAPLAEQTMLDQLLEHVADRQSSRISPAFRQMSGRNSDPVTICILAQYMFRRIHQVAIDPGGPDAGVAGLRPPVFGPRRSRLLRQARMWGERGAEYALKELLAADQALRSGRKVPAGPLVERVLIRIAMARGR